MQPFCHQTQRVQRDCKFTLQGEKWINWQKRLEIRAASVQCCTSRWERRIPKQQCLEVHLVDLCTALVTNPSSCHPSFLSDFFLFCFVFVFFPLPHPHCLEAKEWCPTGASTDGTRNAQRNAFLLCTPLSVNCITVCIRMRLTGHGKYLMSCIAKNSRAIYSNCSKSFSPFTCTVYITTNFVEIKKLINKTFIYLSSSNIVPGRANYKPFLNMYHFSF